MDEQSQPTSGVKLTKFAWLWLGGLALAMISVWPLGWFDTATELTPDHSDILEYCFWLAALVDVISVAVCFFQSKGALASRLLLSVFCFGLIGGLATILLLGTAANIIENHHDFPSESTRTFGALLPIERAYRMDSRTGSSWIIQPAPIWSNIDITHADYSFMLARSGTLKPREEPSNVPSHSYFCAKVTMQESGEALRVLHAGRQALPSGSVGVCSEIASKEPSLTLIQ
jgi:hypothetical protein